jgi:hypothetical protein
MISASETSGVPIDDQSICETAREIGADDETSAATRS